MRRGLGDKSYKHGLIIFASVFIVISHAAVTFALSVSPPSVEISLPAGGSYAGSFTVSNPSNKAIKIQVSVEDWSSPQDGREVAKGERESLGWLSLSPRELELKPHLVDMVNYVVTLPEDAKGEYASMVYFGAVSDSPDGGIQVISRIGNAMYVVVEGTEVVRGALLDIIISRTAPLKIDIGIANEGNIHVRPKGMITVRRKGLFLSKKEKEPIEIPFNEPGFPVRPYQSHIFEMRTKEKLGPGRYSLEFYTGFGENQLQRKFEFKIDRKGKVKIFPEDK